MTLRLVIHNILNESCSDDIFEVEERDVKVDLRKLRPYGRRKLTSKKNRPPKIKWDRPEDIPIHPDDVKIDLSDIEPEQEPEIVDQSVMKRVPHSDRHPQKVKRADIFSVFREGMSAPSCMVENILSNR